MFPSIYPFIRGSASQNKRSPFDRSSNRFFFWLGILIKYKIYYLYIYIYISIYAADRGSLEFDSRVLGNLVLPLIV